MVYRKGPRQFYHKLIKKAIGIHQICYAKEEVAENTLRRKGSDVYESLAEFVRTFNVDMELDDLFEDIAKLSSDEFVSHETNRYYVEKVIEIK